MSENGQIVRKTCRRWNTPWQAHELTFSCYRRQAFPSKDRTCGFLAEAVNRTRDRHDFRVWAYVMMPEHVHLPPHPQAVTGRANDARPAPA